MNIKILLTTALVTLTVPAFAGGNPWVDKVVRASYGGKLVTGRIIHSMGCLYVKFDQTQPGGVVMARIGDSIDSLQLKHGSGWAPADLKAVRKGEAAKCFSEANG